MMSMARLLVAVCAALWAVGPVEAASPSCLFGCPEGAPAANQTVTRSIYVLSANPVTKFADWVAYVVRRDNLAGPHRGRVWRVDPELDAANTITPSEYDGAFDLLRADRGHQAPLAAFKGHDDWKATNYLSNITPQASRLNQGPWKDLEAAVRHLAQTRDVFVMTGPLYEWPMVGLLTDKNHRVPSGYWKIVATEGASIKVAAFYFYQTTPKRADYCDHMQTVDFIEEKTGLDFFSGYAGQATLESARPTLVAGLGCR